ncbi:MAG: hypothetical protein VR64_18600 [Desulfatitalea sp. BRH_c12]|nr:MAG: hypothetical protein VR64_18600 [Desulfatitalea sp. BRH_c12]
MAHLQNHFGKVRNNRGVSAIIVAICITMLIGFVALAVDVGYLYATRNELQNVADAAALAGAGYLGSEYADLTYAEQQTYVCDRSKLVEVVQKVAQKNTAANKSIAIKDELIEGELTSDITIGKWDGINLIETLSSPNAVRVIARRDDEINGPIPSIFAWVFNLIGSDEEDFSLLSVRAFATAALTGPAKVDPGELNTPFALSADLFLNNKCGQTVEFYPTKDSCAGWHTFFWGSNVGNLHNIILGIVQGHSYERDGTSVNGYPLTSGGLWLDQNFGTSVSPLATPEASINQELEMDGGTNSNLFTGQYLVDYDGNNGTVEGSGQPAAFQAMFDYFKYRDDDGNDDHWTAIVPVYLEKDGDPDSCENPNQTRVIAGFATITITQANPPPSSSLTVIIDCNQSFVEGRGGGGNYGNLKGTIPNLVQ